MGGDGRLLVRERKRKLGNLFRISKNGEREDGREMLLSFKIIKYNFLY